MDINENIRGGASESEDRAPETENIAVQNENHHGGKRRRGRGQRHGRRPDQASRDNAIEIVIGADAYDDREDHAIDKPVSSVYDEIDHDGEMDIADNDDIETLSDDITEEPSEGGEQADENTQYEIIGVNFKKTGKIYYFDACGGSYSKDDHVIVETARGLEYGTVILPNKFVSGKEVVLPLRAVVRFANDEDEQHHHENKKREIEAYNACVEKIAEHSLDMKLVDVEYTFDNSKLIFYFTAEGRVDFRDLVKDLASVFRTRIELRQIGIRDEAKLMGGLGICGRPFCCHSFLSDFVQVSIKMAKEQNLSLNSSKISGSCGRLMCCLRYEYDVYSEEIKKTPKVDSVVETEDGEGIVKETLPLAGLVKVEIRNKQDITLKVYNRDEVTVVKGKTAKELIQERMNKDSEVENKDDKNGKSARPERRDRRDRRDRGDKNEKMTVETGSEERILTPETEQSVPETSGAERAEAGAESGAKQPSERGGRGRGYRGGRGRRRGGRGPKGDGSEGGKSGGNE